MLCEKLSAPGHSISKFIVLVILGLASVAIPSAQTQTFTVLHTFLGGADGQDPLDGRLILDAKGNLYGTTDLGGSGACSGGGGNGFTVAVTGGGEEVYTFTGTGGGGAETPEVFLPGAGGATL